MTTAVLFTSVEEARAAGYERIPYTHYGGERICVEGKLLGKNTVRAKSRTEWESLGYKVPAGTHPHAVVRGWHQRYEVFRENQVVPKRKRKPAPPKEIPILAALWAINRRAKRHRDTAQRMYRHGQHGFARHEREAKEHLYSQKGQVLHYLLDEGTLLVVGYHSFVEGQWAEVLASEGYRFHRPCPPEIVPAEVQADVTALSIAAIEAKPKEANEPRLVDARYTINAYLADRPHVECYTWPPRERLVIAKPRAERDEPEPEREDGDEWDDNDHCGVH